MKKYNVACPNCKAKGRVGIEENLLGERVYVLRCKKCGSLSVCRDGVHWSIVMLNNSEKEVKENE